MYRVMSIALKLHVTLWMCKAENYMKPYLSLPSNLRWSSGTMVITNIVKIGRPGFRSGLGHPILSLHLFTESGVLS